MNIDKIRKKTKSVISPKPAVYITRNPSKTRLIIVIAFDTTSIFLGQCGF